MAAVSCASIAFCAGQHFWLADRRRSPLAMSWTVLFFFDMNGSSRVRRSPAKPNPVAPRLHACRPAERLHNASMLKGTLIHPEILRALGRCGHGSKVLITDGNFPHSTS